MIITITEHSPTYSQIDRPELIKDFLTYTKDYYIQHGFGSGFNKYEKRLVDKQGFYLTGFNLRVKKYLRKEGRVKGSTKHVVKYKRSYDIAKPTEPKLKGITFREDQKQALQKILRHKRGVLKAPTGSGKTLMIAGIISAFQYTALIIVHTKALYNQMIEDLQPFFGDIGRIDSNFFSCRDITVAMRTTLSNRLKDKNFVKEFSTSWGMILIDEVHHVSTFDGEYANILKKTQAPIRYGVTATIPKKSEAKMAMEGLVGPLVSITHMRKLQGEGVLAKPKVYLKIAPRVKYLKGAYSQVYHDGIVKNNKRNNMIIKKAKNLVDKGNSVLILVDAIEHGEILQKKGEFIFINGKTKKEYVNDVKEKFKNKEILCVISTKIWFEAVNIPSLNGIINACGGLSEIKVLQIFGRGLRRTKTKNKILMYDFIDVTHKWFRQHSLQRVCIFFENGWIKFSMVKKILTKMNYLKEV